jgi:hypothetical protein
LRSSPQAPFESRRNLVAGPSPRCSARQRARRAACAAVTDGVGSRNPYRIRPRARESNV